jgi:hypothetical protein
MGFFDLPYDVRLKIYRRSRFLDAREHVSNKYTGRQFVREHVSTQPVQCTYRIASFILTETKVMDIEQISSPGWEDDILVVDVCEYGSVALFIFVLDDGSIQATIATELSTRHTRNRVQQDEHNKRYVQWFNERERPHLFRVRS